MEKSVKFHYSITASECAAWYNERLDADGKKDWNRRTTPGEVIRELGVILNAAHCGLRLLVADRHPTSSQRPKQPNSGISNHVRQTIAGAKSSRSGYFCTKGTFGLRKCSLGAFKLRGEAYSGSR